MLVAVVDPTDDVVVQSKVRVTGLGQHGRSEAQAVPTKSHGEDQIM